MKLANATDSAFAPPAQAESAQRLSVRRRIVLLCRMCFAVVPLGAAAFALLMPAPVAVRLGVAVAGLALYGACMAFLSFVQNASSAAVSVLIALGLALMLAAWALALGVV